MRLTTLRPVALALGAVCLAKTTARTQVQTPVEPGPGITNPVLIHQEVPRFPLGTLNLKIRGVVGLDVVIQADGTVGEARVADALDGGTYGFDEEALRVARAFRFKPALRDGIPVPFRASIEIEFLHHESGALAGPGPASYADIAARLKQAAAPGATAAAPSKPVQLVQPGPGITSPVPLEPATPQYREDALRARAEGLVQVEVIVLTDGSVGQARIHKSSASSALNYSALQTARRWRFTPGEMSGTPVPMVAIVPLDFRLGPWSDEQFRGDVHRAEEPALVLPKQKTPPRPQYSADAMRRKIQGVVEIEAVVAPDGIVSRARVTTSLDPRGLDDEALIAARLTTFEPGTLNGKPVPVLVKMQFEFRLDR